MFIKYFIKTKKYLFLIIKENLKKLKGDSSQLVIWSFC